MENSAPPRMLCSHGFSVYQGYILLCGILKINSCISVVISAVHYCIKCIKLLLKNQWPLFWSLTNFGCLAGLGLNTFVIFDNVVDNNLEPSKTDGTNFEKMVVSQISNANQIYRISCINANTFSEDDYSIVLGRFCPPQHKKSM